MTPIFIAGMRGTGKRTAATKLGDVAEVIDAEYLQYRAAALIEPDMASEDRAAWQFWTGDRLKRMPKVLNDVFVSKHGSDTPPASFLVVNAAILVKDWYFAPLAAVLAVRRPSIDWSAARYLVLDYTPEEIHARTLGQDGPADRKPTLESVQETARSYREHHALQSFVPWQLIQSPGQLDEILRDVCEDQG